MPARKVKRFKGSKLTENKAGKKRLRAKKRPLIVARAGIQRVYAFPGTAPLMRYCILEPNKHDLLDKNGSSVWVRSPHVPSFARVTL